VLYYFLAPLIDDFPAFRLITFITFRVAGATVTAIFLAFLVGPAIIRRLRRRTVGQVIRADGPASHQTKRGTPTMGGLIIIVSTVVPAILWARLDNQRFVLVAVFATLWMGLIGFIDDYLKIVEGKSRGLIARYKLVGQIAFGAGLALSLLYYPVTGSQPNTTTLPFFKYVTITLHPIIYLAFVTFVTAAMSNAVNVTDGLDGLAAGLTVIAAGTFAVFCYIFGRTDATAYLLLPYLAGAGELAIFCSALMGASLGFLWFNAHPAEVFMGDTGSLAIGGALGAVAIMLKSEFLLVLVGGVFVAEIGSVLIQTSVYKYLKRTRGKEYADNHRVFRMAPLHHHFEKLGWAEPKVVTRFYLLGILSALFALSTLKIR
jgi:phospho-N-acetylmuramoyl-pentapeptide-transferase